MKYRVGHVGGVIPIHFVLIPEMSYTYGDGDRGSPWVVKSNFSEKVSRKIVSPDNGDLWKFPPTFECLH